MEHLENFDISKETILGIKKAILGTELSFDTLKHFLETIEFLKECEDKSEFFPKCKLETIQTIQSIFTHRFMTKAIENYNKDITDAQTHRRRN